MCEHGYWVYDPRGYLESRFEPIAPRLGLGLENLDGARLAVLDNGKWNARALLDAVVERLASRVSFAAVERFRKASFSRNADPEQLAAIAAGADLAVTAIGD